MRISTLFVLSLFSLSSLARVHDVTQYGADIRANRNIDSDAINGAIERAASEGGGLVYLPAGSYECYSIRLKSHVNLYLEQGAKIVAVAPKKNGKGIDDPEESLSTKFQDFGHSHWQNSLIWGVDIEDVTISGPGLIDGHLLTRGEHCDKGIGNKAIALKDCKNITISDISMLTCGHFALLATGIDNLDIHHIKVDTNRDGLDIDCCRNVRISDCSVNTPWDDAIVLKASYALGRFKDTENVTISNCYVSGFDRETMLNCTWQRNDNQAPDKGFVTGRIKLGTESSGGFKNIAITNCIFERCRGLALETVDGGHLEDVVVSNITMRDIVNAPIFLRLGARQRSPEGTPNSTFRRVRIENVNVYGADSRYSCIVAGIPEHPIEDVSFQNIHIYFKGGYKKEDVAANIPEEERSYPEPWIFGTVPAKGFYLRHVKGITFDNISFHYEQDDTRPLFVSEDTQDAYLDRIYVEGKLLNKNTYYE